MEEIKQEIIHFIEDTNNVRKLKSILSFIKVILDK